MVGPGGILVRGLEDGEPEVRAAAVKAVMPVGQRVGGDVLVPTVIPVLTQLASDTVRSHACFRVVVVRSHLVLRTGFLLSLTASHR